MSDIRWKSPLPNPKSPPMVPAHGGWMTDRPLATTVKLPPMKTDLIHPRTTPDLSVVTLVPQTQTPLVVLDRRWCFDAPTTLRVSENPATHKIKVRDEATGDTLLEIRRVVSTLGDLFHVFDCATQEQILTVDGFGFQGRFDVFRGLQEQGQEREPGVMTVVTTHATTTTQFEDIVLRRPSRALVDGGWRDRVVVVSVHHGIAWQPVARISRPEHGWLKLPHHTIEIPAGVDALLPIVMWLARWAQLQVETRVGARPVSTSPFWGQPSAGSSR